MILPALLVAATFTWTPIPGATAYRLWYTSDTSSVWQPGWKVPSALYVDTPLTTAKVSGEPFRICARVQVTKPTVGPISNEYCHTKFPMPPTNLRLTLSNNPEE
jgi:hypothetical protein